MHFKYISWLSLVTSRYPLLTITRYLLWLVTSRCVPVVVGLWMALAPLRADSFHSYLSVSSCAKYTKMVRGLLVAPIIYWFVITYAGGTLDYDRLYTSLNLVRPGILWSLNTNIWWTIASKTPLFSSDVYICSTVNFGKVDTDFFNTQLVFPCRVILVVDSKRLFADIVRYVHDAWPPQYIEVISFQYQPVYYPPDRLDMRDMFRTCATERLFLPDILTKEDAVIYLDTDIVFMGPPEQLWYKFYEFNSSQLAAMAPCDNQYGGRYGLNVS